MWLVNSYTLFPLWLDWVDMLPNMLVFFFWVPENAIEQNISLNLVSCPSWVSIHPAAVCSFNVDLILCVMFNSWTTIFKCLQGDGEAPKIISLAMEFTSIPSVKISMNSHSFCSWTPLHECDIIIWLQLKTKLLVRSSKLQNTTFSSLENVKPPTDFK